MKFLLYVVFVCGIVALSNALSLTPEQKEKLEQHHKVCTAETNIDQKEITNAKKGKFSDSAVLKQYVFCNLKRANLVNEKGRLNEDVLYAKMPKDTNMLAAKVITELCKSQEGVDPADRAYKMYRCYYEATPTHVSLI